MANLPEPHAVEAAAILAELRRAAQADELTVPLAPALRRAQTDATALLRRATGGGGGTGAGAGSGRGAGAGSGAGSEPAAGRPAQGDAGRSGAAPWPTR